MNLNLNLAGPPEDPTRFVPLLIVLGLAFIIPLLLSKFRRLPNVVGEIIFGVLVGPSLLGWVTEGPILTFMSDIGLAFLMFLAGMEIEFDLIFKRQNKNRSQGPSVLRSSIILYILTFALSVLGATFVQQIGLEADFWMLLFVLSATSLGVLLPILKERQLLETVYGKIIFLTAMLADFVTVILLTVYLITLDKGFDPEIFSLGLLFTVFLVLYKLGPGFIRIPSVTNLINRLSGATVQIKVRGAIAILMAFVVLAEFVDAELILGAFLAGMIISLIKRPEDDGLIHNLEAFGFGFFIPVFFIMVGVNLDIQALLASPENLIALPWFLLIALLIKVLPMVSLKRHFSWKEILAGGFLLNTHLSLEVAIAVIGLRAGLFTQTTSTTVIVFSILTVILMPYIFTLLAPKTAAKSQPYTLIVGLSDLGVKVAEQLRAHGDKVQFIPCDPFEVKTAAKKNFPSLGFTIEQIAQIDPQEIHAALVLHDDDKRNLELSQKARSIDIETVISQVTDPQYLEQFEDIGVKTFSPALMRATIISMMARNPNALDLLTTTSDERDSIEVVVRNQKIVGKKLRELQIPGDLLVLAIRRNKHLLIPRGGTTFELFDKVTLLGGTEDLKSAKKLLLG